MKKKFVTTVLIALSMVAIMFLPACSNHDEPTPQRLPSVIYEYDYNTDKATLTRVYGDSINFTVPSTVEKDGQIFSVNAIGEETFIRCKNLKNIHIPASIRQIGLYAFNNTNISKLYIESLESWCNINFIDFTSMHHYNPYTYGNPINKNTTVFVNGEAIGETLTIPADARYVAGFAFQNLSGIKKLKLSEGISSIGLMAFESCGSLEELYLPSNMKHISIGAFENTPIGKVHIPSVGDWFHISLDYSYDSEYGYYNHFAFDGTFSLYVDDKQIKDIVVPGDIETIHEFACRNLNIQSVTVEEGVKKIGMYGLSNSLIKEIVIPKSLETIENGAFAGTQIENITIPGGVKTISGGLLGNCSNLKSVIIEEGIEDIEMQAFAFCSRLEDITFPTTLKQEFYAFKGCKALSSLTFPEGFEKITDDFRDCESLETISFPSKLTYFDCSFLNCYRLTAIEMKCRKLPEIKEKLSVYPENIFEKCTLYVPKGCIEEYRNNSFFGKFQNIEEKIF